MHRSPHAEKAVVSTLTWHRIACSTHTGRQSGQALKGGTIIFKSADHPTLTITGEIKTDGSFTLVTLVDGKGKKVEGAPEGKHEIVVYPPSDDNQMSEDITVLNPKQTVEPKENQCKVEIEKVRRR
jgi:hypothetical protein